MAKIFHLALDKTEFQCCGRLLKELLGLVVNNPYIKHHLSCFKWFFFVFHWFNDVVIVYVNDSNAFLF